MNLIFARGVCLKRNTNWTFNILMKGNYLKHVSQVKDKHEESDQDNQSDDYFADCVDTSSISCFVTEDLGFEIVHECDKLINRKCCIKIHLLFWDQFQ